LRASGPIDLAIMPIGAYNPWIHSHCTPEQAVHMANEAGAHYIIPVHHQTFRFSAEGFRERSATALCRRSVGYYCTAAYSKSEDQIYSNDETYLRGLVAMGKDVLA
jgi:L-ascorbate metabolism protein UlaG (beta-lactamase superfamily)